MSDVLRSVTKAALADEPVSPDAALAILTDQDLDLLPLINAAYSVRLANWGKTVRVHRLNNVANGDCPEDCSYCSQAKSSTVDIEDYRMKSEDEILAEAELAYRNGSYRYCMVFSGRGPSKARTEQVAGLVRKIKEAYPIEVCVSAGLLDDDKAAVLAEAGLDRLNHNLNTSEERYGDICTTHTYRDRLETLKAAKRNGLEACSGLIAGMGEPPSDLVEIATTLRSLDVESIPVNFLLPFEGDAGMEPVGLTPDYCLRVLCMFRFTNPRAEVRVAAGREVHFGSLEVMTLYPANSLFADGYLNVRGSGVDRTYKMITDAGFDIEMVGSEGAVFEGPDSPLLAERPVQIGGRPVLKTIEELRPFQA